MKRFARSGALRLMAEITPSALALNLYFKTNALNSTPYIYWKDSLEEYTDSENLNLGEAIENSWCDRERMMVD